MYRVSTQLGICSNINKGISFYTVSAHKRDYPGTIHFFSECYTVKRKSALRFTFAQYSLLICTVLVVVHACFIWIKSFRKNHTKSDVPWQKWDLIDGFLSFPHYLSPFGTKGVIWGDISAKSLQIYFVKIFLTWHMSLMPSGLSSSLFSSLSPRLFFLFWR